jgi:hypothetical protein
MCQHNTHTGHVYQYMLHMRYRNVVRVDVHDITHTQVQRTSLKILRRQESNPKQTGTCE